MPTPGSAIYSFQPPLLPPPTGVTAALQHQRAAVTGAENTLSSFLTGGVIPNGTNQATAHVYPHGVFLQVESADAATKCFVTVVGLAASATLGVEIPSGPGGIYFEIPYALANDLVRVLSAGTTHVQCIFYY
jgi:hypothetical protein